MQGKCVCVCTQQPPRTNTFHFRPTNTVPTLTFEVYSIDSMLTNTPFRCSRKRKNQSQQQNVPLTPVTDTYHAQSGCHGPSGQSLSSFPPQSSYAQSNAYGVDPTMSKQARTLSSMSSDTSAPCTSMNPSAAAMNGNHSYAGNGRMMMSSAMRPQMANNTAMYHRNNYSQVDQSFNATPTANNNIKQHQQQQQQLEQHRQYSNSSASPYNHPSSHHHSSHYPVAGATGSMQAQYTATNNQVRMAHRLCA